MCVVPVCYPMFKLCFLLYPPITNQVGIAVWGDAAQAVRSALLRGSEMSFASHSNERFELFGHLHSHTRVRKAYLRESWGSSSSFDLTLICHSLSPPICIIFSKTSWKLFNCLNSNQQFHLCKCFSLQLYDL